MAGTNDETKRKLQLIMFRCKVFWVIGDKLWPRDELIRCISCIMPCHKNRWYISTGWLLLNTVHTSSPIYEQRQHHRLQMNRQPITFDILVWNHSCSILSSITFLALFLHFFFSVAMFLIFKIYFSIAFKVFTQETGFEVRFVCHHRFLCLLKNFFANDKWLLVSS